MFFRLKKCENSTQKKKNRIEQIRFCCCKLNKFGDAGGGGGAVCFFTPQIWG
jgi:hypothetical protein